MDWFFFSQGLANINDKLNVANEELMLHLREKGEVSNRKIDRKKRQLDFLACSRSSSTQSCINGY